MYATICWLKFLKIAVYAFSLNTVISHSRIFCLAKVKITCVKIIIYKKSSITNSHDCNNY